jgi:phage gpG-like protein
MKNQFDKILADFKNLKTRLPKMVGLMAVAFFKDNFRKQGFEDSSHERWKGRKALDKNPKNRAILIKSGRLRNSIKILKTAPSAVVVGSLLPYSDIHNEGGTIIQQPTEKQKAFFWAKFKETGNTIWKRMATAENLKIDIPKRQFIGKSKTLDRQIDNFITQQIKKLFP